MSNVKKATFLSVGVIVIILILIFVFQSCSIQKRDNQLPQQPPQSEDQGVSQPPQISEIEVQSALPETPQNSEQPVEPIIEVVEYMGFEEVVSVPDLSAEITSSAVVSGKKVYNTGNGTYAFTVVFILASDTQADGHLMVEYYCPKRTYDALSVGQTINVTYQVDSNSLLGVVSIGVQ